MMVSQLRNDIPSLFFSNLGTSSFHPIPVEEMTKVFNELTEKFEKEDDEANVKGDNENLEG